MIKTHKVKIYPNATMSKELEKLFDYRRFVWNKGLEVWREMYEESQLMADKHLKPNERKVRDELVRDKADWQYQLSARVLQLAVKDLAKAWNNFFNPNMPNHRPPRFKSKKRFAKTFTTDRAKIIAGKLRLDKPREGISKWFDIRLAEFPRWNGELKQVTVKLEADGYYASLVIEVPEVAVNHNQSKVTGVDANIGRFVYQDDDGYQMQATLPNGLLKLYERVTLYQRQLARKRVENPKNYNSKQYQTTRAKLKRCYQRITRVQGDVLNKFTSKLVANYGVIGIENLDCQHMKMDKRLAKNLHRSMFGKFQLMMQYKAAWQGVTLVCADRFFPSTQRCSNCGHIKTGVDKITLNGNREHGTKHHEYFCYECGFEANRDENAVENLKQYAINSVWGQAIVPTVG
jgi:putative transposase